MNPIVQNLTGMSALTDQILAADLLNSAKTGVRNLSVALTESATPQVRQILKQQLDKSIALHEQVTNYMVGQGWYQAYNVPAQIQMDLQNAQKALSMTSGG